MTRIEPLSDEHLDDAAALLAIRHARHLAAEPLLARVTDFRAQIENELRRERAGGAVALRDGRIVGYLAGHVEVDAVGEPRALLGLAGCAASDAEVVRDLYATLAADWMAAACRRHTVYVPATDTALVDAWFRLAFGCQFVTAVRETTPALPIDADVEIRAGTPDDLDAVAEFDRMLWELQSDSPSFSGLDPSGEDFAGEWRNVWDDPTTAAHFIAEHDGRTVGHTLLYRRPTGDLRVPDANVDLAHVATLPEVRGKGIGVALTAYALAWANEHGFRSMTTDWRSVNLLSSRFWPRRGFRPTFLRLYRAVP
jgi:GNAT superfamily N-acetyltransferase